MEIIKAFKVKENVNGATVIIADIKTNFGDEWLLGILYEEDIYQSSFYDVCGKREYNKQYWQFEEVLERFEEYVEKAKHNYIFG